MGMGGLGFRTSHAYGHAVKHIDMHIDLCIGVRIGMRRASHRWKALAEAVILSTGTSLRAQWQWPSAMPRCGQKRVRELQGDARERRRADDEQGRVLCVAPRRLYRLYFGIADGMSIARV